MNKTSDYLMRIFDLSDAGKFVFISIICGGSASFARFFISNLGQIKVAWEDPIHMSWLPSICLGISAFIGGTILTFVLVKTIIGESYIDRNLLIWLIIGLIYGVFVSFITGLFIPMGLLVMNLIIGVVELSKAPYFFLDAIVLAPTTALTHGIYGVITGLLGGLCMASILWILDKLRSLGFQWQFIVGMVFSVFMLTVSKFGPAPFLARFG